MVAGELFNSAAGGLLPIAPWGRSSLWYLRQFSIGEGTPSVLATLAVKRGYELYIGDAGCGSCHVLSTFDKAEKEDVGTGGQFKVPSLRAVGTTAPYFHDGRTPSLREAVKFMWQAYAKKANASREPTDAELDDLVAYVGSL